jgi:hypothetical protein
MYMHLIAYLNFLNLDTSPPTTNRNITPKLDRHIKDNEILSSSLALQDGGISDTSSSSLKRGRESQVEEYDNPIVDWDSQVEKEHGDVMDLLLMLLKAGSKIKT